MNLRKKIHTELLSENQRRNESLIIESKIIKSHLSTIKNCETFDCLFENILNKISKFKSKGFSDKLINESTFELITSLFGEPSESFWEEVKSRYADHIISNMKIEDEYKEHVKNEIIKTPNEDITKLMSDPDFVSDKIATSYVDYFQDKFLQSGVDQDLGPAGKEIKNAIASLLSDTGFMSRLSGKIGGQIETVLNKIKDRDEQIADKIKSTVMGG